MEVLGDRRKVGRFLEDSAMDCRSSNWLALSLLLAVAGCHQVVTLQEPGGVPVQSQVASAKAMPAPIDPAKIKPAPDLPKRQPKPETLVAFGDFRAGEAFAPDLPAAKVSELREQARLSYQQAINLDSQHVPAYLGLARLYTAAQDHAHAMQTYQQALRIAPRNAAVWYEAGMFHNYQREWDQAVTCLHNAVDLDPNNRDYVNALGIVLARAGHYDEAFTCFRRICDEALAHYKLARTLQHLQQPELSRQHLEKALQKDPNLASAQAMKTELAGPETPSTLSTPETTAIQRTSYRGSESSADPANPALPQLAPASTPVAPMFVQPVSPREEAAKPAAPPRTLPATIIEPAPTIPGTPAPETTPVPEPTAEAVSPPRPAIVLPPPPMLNLEYELPKEAGKGT
jgi:hypothetical protein